MFEKTITINKRSASEIVIIFKYQKIVRVFFD